MAIQGNPVVGMDPFAQALASFPDVTPPKPANDGNQWSAGENAGTTAFPKMGRTLRDANADLLFRAIDGLVRSQDRMATNRYAIDTYFRWIRQGIPFGRLEKIPNQSIWVARLPNGMNRESTSGVPNKSDDLCNKLEDTLMSDPPKPLPEARVGDEAAEEAAKLASRWLSDDAGENGTNDILAFRWCINNALAASSSFLHTFIDPVGGGSQPLQVLAHPQATDPNNPLVAMVPSGVVDPMTGQPQMMEERAVNPILRYVSPPAPDAPTGRFVEMASEADRVWLAKTKVEYLRREHVRIFPPTARVEDAQAVAILGYCTLDDGRHKWPDTVGQMDDVTLRSLANWRPSLGEQAIIPYALRNGLQDGQSGPALAEVGTLSPLLQRRMFYYTIYVAQSPEYPDGFTATVNGLNGGTILSRGDLSYTVTLPTGGKEKRCREIPVAQYTPQKDVLGGDPMGYPVISRFAGASEASATLYAAMMDMCDNMLHPHVFIPGTVSIDEEDWADRTRPITYNAAQGNTPSYEQFPTLPPVMQVLGVLDEKMDVSSGLTATAQGLDTSSSVSGVAKQLSVRQSQVYLSGFNQELKALATRYWRLKLQLVQAYYTTPQLIQATGEEGSAEAKWWTGDDLAGVDRIGLQPGSGTMMTPEAKANYVAFLQGQQWMTPEAAAEVAVPSIKIDLGIPADPVEEALNRSVGVWLQGPTQEWLAAFEAHQGQVAQAKAAYDQQVASVMQGPQVQEAKMRGIPLPPVPPFQPPPSNLPNPFTPRPCDSEPSVALRTIKALRDVMLHPKYSAFPKSWQSLVDEAYLAARRVVAPPEVGAAQGQQQAQAAPQAGSANQPVIPAGA